MMKMNGEDRSGWYKSNNQQENQKTMNQNGKATYTAKYACGCEDTKEYASLDHARVWQAKVAMKQCLKCHYVAKQTDGRDSYAHQLLNQLPALKGTPAQINWAASIRQRYLDALGECGQPVKGNIVIAKTKKAAQWIAMKDRDFEEDIAQLIAGECPIKYLVLSVGNSGMERIMEGNAVVINIPLQAIRSDSITEWIVSTAKDSFAEYVIILNDTPGTNVADIIEIEMNGSGIETKRIDYNTLSDFAAVERGDMDIESLIKVTSYATIQDAIMRGVL